jgi:TetR/AcrR family tetracycline transcriptional repressor
VANVRVDSLRIADEALKLLCEGGLEAVSIRRIAAGLGVGVSTLYWHIQDKDALLGALRHRIFRNCLDAVGDQDSWQSWLHAFGLALWQAQIEIPDVRKLIVLARPDPERQRPTTAEISGMLQRRGAALRAGPGHGMDDAGRGQSARDGR